MKGQLTKDKIAKLVRFAGPATVYVFMLFVLIHFSAYVYKFQALSYFDGTFGYFAGLFRYPAAIVLWTGRFLTQFCLYPVVGAILLVALLSVIGYMVWRFIFEGRGLSSISILPSVVLFLFITRLGYRLFTVRSDALIFTQVVGITFALLAFYFLKSSERKIPAALAVALVGYPLAGFYALLPLAMSAVEGIRHKDYLYIATCVASAAVAPLLYYLVVYNNTGLEYMWLQGTPYLDSYGDVPGFLPLWVTCGLLVLFPAFKPARKYEGVPGIVADVLIYAVCFSALNFFPDRQALLHRQLRSEVAIEKGNWGEALMQTTGTDVTNDVLIAYRNIALYNLGRLEKDCARYSFNVVPMSVAGVPVSSSRICGPTVYYYSGLINFAERWCSELDLYSELSMEHLKYRAKVNILNGNYAQAEMYLDAIGRSTLNKPWARRYREFISHPETIGLDAEFAGLLPLQEYDVQKWMSSDEVARDVLNFYYAVEGRSPEFVEWHRMARMILL
mgnify:CR=1 FL=1